MGVTAAGSVANEATTTDLSSQGFENVRSSDAAREARETFSHTTQLSQMYHQLDSYHLGSNRAAFYVLPRPHVIQSPATFVNGPREIEGIQEFMLVVVRPKAMEDFCVEAYLETAHLVRKPIPHWGRTEKQLLLHIQTGDTTRVSASNSSASQPGYVVDTDLGGSLGGNNHGPGKGYTITSENIGPWNGDYAFTVGTEVVTVNGWVEGHHFEHPEETIGCTMDVAAAVHLKKREPGIGGYKPGLMITARAVCSCRRSLSIKKVVDGPSVVYEKSLGKPEAQLIQQRESISIREANQLGADIKRELLKSLSSADRYPRGKVTLLDTQLFSEMMGTHIRHADRGVNTRLLDWPGIDKKLARRVTAYVPSMTRSQLLEMPLTQQVENFGLSYEEAVGLRRSLADIAEPKGPPPIAEQVQIEVPLLSGLQKYEKVPLQPNKTVASAPPKESAPPAGDLPELQGAPDLAPPPKGVIILKTEGQNSQPLVNRKEPSPTVGDQLNPIPPSDVADLVIPPPAAAELNAFLNRLKWGENEPGERHPTLASPAAPRPAADADPVDLFSGAFTIRAVDLTVPTPFIPIAMSRSYRSGRGYFGPFGYGWDHAYSIYLRQLNDGGFALWTGQLREQHFRNTGAAFEPEAGYCARLERLPGIGEVFSVTFPGGTQWLFERPSGWSDTQRIPLVTIRDRHGNPVVLTYGSIDRVVSVLDDAGRGLLFHYGSCELLELVTDHTGARDVRYAHDPEFEHLLRVVLPATAQYPKGLPTTYEYDSDTRHPAMQHNILRILDAEQRLMVENEYAAPDAGWEFNSVVRQRMAGFEYQFEYEQIQYVAPDVANVDALCTRTLVLPAGRVAPHVHVQLSRRFTRSSLPPQSRWLLSRRRLQVGV